MFARIAKLLVGAARKNTRLDAYLREQYSDQFDQSPQFGFVPPGHYYSPLPDISYVEENAAGLYSEPGEPTGLRLNELEQERLLREFVPYYREFDWTELPIAGRRFDLNNDFFGYADAIALFCMLRHFAPTRVIEVGSGHTSALMLDTLDRFPREATRFTFIEPYPDRLLALLNDHDKRTHEVIHGKVQDVPFDCFDRLKANDILFIDSSHVSKAASDVHHLMFKVLPRLNPGVVVHFHDIFWPFEYPLAWIREGRAWNEGYLVRAFLQYNAAFQMILFNDYAGKRFRGLLSDLMPLFLKNTGGSLWLRKAS